MSVKKLREKIRPVAKQISDNPPIKGSGSFKSLAEIMWSWYQRKEKEWELFEQLEQKAKSKSKGGDINA